MNENEKVELSPTVKKLISVIAFVLVIAIIISIPVTAWFITQGQIAAYAPVSAPEALYIGAGHIHFAASSSDVDEYEDIRYLYLEGVDYSQPYFYYVFCVYGKSISGFKLQIAHTTNNQFVYDIFCAEEITKAEYDLLTPERQADYISYTTHGVNPTTYYYTTVGVPITLNALNRQEVDGEDLATSTYHDATYDYDNVDKYAEPIYWQSSGNGDYGVDYMHMRNGVIKGDSTSDFVRYFILRIDTNGKTSNDRETDIICLAAKSGAYSAGGGGGG